MSEPVIKEALRALAEQAVQRVAEHDRGWQYFSGAKAMQDMSRRPSYHRVAWLRGRSHGIRLVFSST